MPRKIHTTSYPKGDPAMRIIVLAFSLLFCLGTLNAQATNLFQISSSKGFLKPDEAFKAKAHIKDKSVVIEISLGDKIHIYAKDLRFKLTKPVERELKVKLPEPVKYEKFDVYYGDMKLKIPLDEIIKYTKSGTFTLRVDMAGCSDSGICYQPKSFSFDLKTKIREKSDSGTGQKKTNKELKKNTAPTKENLIDKVSRLASGGNSGAIAEALAGESTLFVLALFFIAGLMLSMTPCILPMIPILSSIIVNQSGSKSGDSGKRPAAFFISIVYVVSMAATYAVIGVVAGLLGFDLQAQMSNPWVIFPVSALFLALSLSLFGYYDLALPSSWQQKLTRTSDNARGKGVLGTMIMGSLSALIVGTCTAPVISGAIVFISMTGDAVLGGLSLFVMGVGAGVPLLLMGAGAEKFVPKPGVWMTRISRLFGVIMLMMALYVLRGVIPEWLYMLLFSILFTGSAIFMDVFAHGERTTTQKYIQTLAILLLLYGAMLFVGALSGSKSPLYPLEPFVSDTPSSRNDYMRNSQEGTGYSVEKLKREIAKAAGKPVIVDIGKKNCAACSELEHITFADEKVAAKLKEFKFIKIDISANTKEEQKLLKHYGVFGAPNILFFDREGNPMPDKFLVGFIEPDRFLEHLESITKSR